MEDHRKRQTNFSPQEKERLLQLCRKYQTTIECKLTDKLTWKRKENTWAKIEKEYNGAVIGEYRPAASLKKKYESVKTALKKACEQQRALSGPRGYPFHPPPETTTNEEKYMLENIVISLFGFPRAECDCDAVFFTEIFKNDEPPSVLNTNQPPKIDHTSNDVLQPIIKQCDTTLNQQSSSIPQVNKITSITHRSPSTYSMVKQAHSQNNEPSVSSDSGNFYALTRKKLELVNLEISLLQRKAALTEEKHKMKMALMKKKWEHKQYLINSRREKHVLAVQHWSDENSD